MKEVNSKQETWSATECHHFSNVTKKENAYMLKLTRPRFTLPFMALLILILATWALPVAASETGPRATITTSIRDQRGVLPCFNPDNQGPQCAGQVAPAGDVVWDTAKVWCNVGVPCFGTVEFRFFAGSAHCSGGALYREEVNLTGPIAKNTTGAISLAQGPLIAGDYSFRAFYRPDAAAQALGITAPPWGLQGECEQLRVR